MTNEPSVVSYAEFRATGWRRQFASEVGVEACLGNAEPDLPQEGLLVGGEEAAV